MLASGGCQFIPQRMPTPPALQGVAPLQVQRGGLMGLTGPMTVGPWKVTDISVGPWTHRCSHHLVSFDTIGGQTYAFTVTSQEKVLHALCEIKRSARFYRWNDEPEESGRYSYLECKFHGSEGNLHLDETLPKGRKEGRVTFGTLAWKIRSAHGDGDWMDSINPRGYEIVRGYTVIAAVETVAGRRIWIDPALSEEDQQHIIGIAGALLLYEPPEGYQQEDCK
jgi:hypothetical protein